VTLFKAHLEVPNPINEYLPRISTKISHLSITVTSITDFNRMAIIQGVLRKNGLKHLLAISVKTLD
jgi:hypothetical protein